MAPSATIEATLPASYAQKTIFFSGTKLHLKPEVKEIPQENGGKEELPKAIKLNNRFAVSAMKAVPKLWKNPSSFAMNALQSPWYTTMFGLQSTLFHSSIDFFRHDLGYKYLVVPVTTSSISSPMGLGSDSQPVSLELAGLQTYLADSQQFVLEYALRLEDGLPGSYYVGTSCRGEDPDSTHLNQFCHVECELLGGLADGVAVANRYVVAMTQAMLREHKTKIEVYAGTTSHLTQLLDLYRKHNNSFPMVTLEEVLAMPEITDDMWQYAVEGEPRWGRSLTRKGERMLIEKFGGACWLTEMDHLSVPFYQAYTDGTKRKGQCADFLLGLGEVIGCGNRHVSAEQALEALEHHEVDPAEYKWYTDMRQLKELNTTGWGIGTERFLCWVMQHDDVRDIQLLPRLKGVACAP
ncbi:asparaginyl-tRNA synthetase-1 [Coleophoma cylindrospora]|uniref:Asparaginyl-tRNA synthetase-1 n=1 Tax=Coleophoma cylindrospora TaxID=1849047 RepID=A0A3D8QQ10_9HELO|nr:asparaginyl-tRNA synthetase-1 [Coleophoma cylindrospora]